MASGVFKKADIDTTQCDLCGVKFLQSEPLDKEPTEPTTPTEADWEGVGERNENLVADKTYESHIRLDVHRNNCIAYQKYREYFGNMVEPLINNGRNVLERIADATRIKGRFTAKEDAKLVRRKIEEGIKSISDMVEDLYKRKAWADAEETMSKWAEHLKSNVDDGMSWVEKAESSLLKEEDFDLDKDLESEVKDEGRTFEELYHKKPSRKKGKSKRK
ncbi:hypothetical protein JRQ81_018915 [Phrynocephalus forsythii]|uniref:Uncharacterized protein n=1 Tax=Phrynocephalus forsythii TaxID=171643 RepID=A0A9Q0XPG2_9SAUR|nr:hypothetical protein JRQ81_018915 [Phrynocephalus forsythii]